MGLSNYSYSSHVLQPCQICKLQFTGPVIFMFIFCLRLPVHLWTSWPQVFLYLLHTQNVKIQAPEVLKMLSEARLAVKWQTNIDMVQFRIFMFETYIETYIKVNQQKNIFHIFFTFFDLKSHCVFHDNSCFHPSSGGCRGIGPRRGCRGGVSHRCLAPVVRQNPRGRCKVQTQNTICSIWTWKGVKTQYEQLELELEFNSWEVEFIN